MADCTHASTTAHANQRIKRRLSRRAQATPARTRQVNERNRQFEGVPENFGGKSPFGVGVRRLSRRSGADWSAKKSLKAWPFSAIRTNVNLGRTSAKVKCALLPRVWFRRFTL